LLGGADHAFSCSGRTDRPFYQASSCNVLVRSGDKTRPPLLGLSVRIRQVRTCPEGGPCQQSVLSSPCRGQRRAAV